MAVIITDNRTVVNEADAVTGWTATSGVAVFTSAPDPVEATGSLGTQVSNSTETSYQTITAANLTNTIVYAWLLPGGVIDTVVNGGTQIYLGDNTDNIGFHVGGSNGAGFRHDQGPVTWQCFALDTGVLPANSTVYNGVLGNLTLTAITRVGNAFKTLAKSVGGIENCFMDIAFYGNGGLTITGGGTGTEGKFLEIAVRDRSGTDHPGTGVASAAGGAYGICRELGADLFGLQGRMQFGSATTGSVNFSDVGQTIVFEDRGFGTDKYGYTITGNVAGTTSFILGTRGGVGIGTNGCSLVTPSGVGAFFTASSVNINTLGLYNCGLSGFTQGVTFTSDATTGPNHEIFATSFSGNGLITIGTTEFKNNSISGSTATSATLISTTTNVSDLAFTSVGTGHAITIATPGTYTFSNFTYIGYAAINGSTGNESFYNNSGGLVTINVVGGSSPTVRNGVGASTVINNNINITATNLKENTEVRVYLTSTLDSTPPYGIPTEIAGIENATAGTFNFRTFTFTVAGGTGITIRTINTNWIADDVALSPSSTQDVQISQRQDRVFRNPA
jgi:hypothetical protein